MQKRIKILIIRLSALGDTIHTLPLVACIKKAYPNCTIGWVVEDKAKHFVENNPLIDKTYVIPKKEWKKRGFSFQNLKEFFSITNDIKKENYDIALDTQQLLKSGLILGFSGAKRKITLDKGREFSSFFANEIIKTQRPLFDINYHVVERNLDLVRYLGVNCDEINFALPEISQSTQKHVDDLIKNIDKSKPIVVISPATTWENKHWTEKNFSEVVKELTKFSNIIITGTANDTELVNNIKTLSNCENILDLSAQTTLEDLTYLFSKATLVISPDSGSANIAWATQKPYVITLFTATSANRTAPFGDKYFAIQSDVICSPCMKRKCANKDHYLCCQNSITAQDVIEKAKAIL